MAQNNEMNDNALEQQFQITLSLYLLSKDKIDEHFPEAPDIEEKWSEIIAAFMPDAIREFNEYPTAVFGWMMYIGMAVAKYWDLDWELYSKVENLYIYLRDRIDFDHLDDYILEKVLMLDHEATKELQNLVIECAEKINLEIIHMQIEPGTKEAFHAVVDALHQFYLFGSAIELKALGYHMTKLGE